MYTLCSQVNTFVLFCGGGAARRVAEYCSASPFPRGTTCRRTNAWTNPLGVARVNVRPRQRCSETPPGGTAPGDTTWLQTASALRALKCQRAVLLPMARTGFGYLCGQGTSLTMSTCRTSASHLSFIFKSPRSTSPGFQISKGSLIRSQKYCSWVEGPRVLPISPRPHIPIPCRPKPILI